MAVRPLVRLAVLPFLAAWFAALASVAEPGCHEYDGKAVSLLGTIRLETFPGKPNFLSVHRADEPVSEFVLQLLEPVCVKSQRDGEKGPLPALAGIEKVQALMPIDLPIEAELLGRLGEPVWLHGKLIAPASPYHYLPVLIEARRVTPVYFDRPEAPEVPDFPPSPSPSDGAGR